MTGLALGFSGKIVAYPLKHNYSPGHSDHRMLSARNAQEKDILALCLTSTGRLSSLAGALAIL